MLGNLRAIHPLSHVLASSRYFTEGSVNLGAFRDEGLVLVTGIITEGRSPAVLYVKVFDMTGTHQDEPFLTGAIQTLSRQPVAAFAQSGWTKFAC